MASHEKVCQGGEHIPLAAISRHSPQPRLVKAELLLHDPEGVLSFGSDVAWPHGHTELNRLASHFRPLGDPLVARTGINHCLLTMEQLGGRCEVVHILVERRSGFAIIKKLRARTTLELNAAAIHAITEHRKMFRTITLDNGTEFHDYKQLESRFSIKCYFATPYHSWERGSNENLNGLIRQYVPKGSCMKLLTSRTM